VVIGDGGGGFGPISQEQRLDMLLKASEVGAVEAAGGYVVDPERAQTCIDELTRIVGEVRAILVPGMGYFTAPGLDEVSVNVAHNGAIMASRARSYLRAWALTIEATRDALRRQLDAYRSVETSNSRS
jgi:hypothetical protein